MPFISELLTLRHMPNRLCLLGYSPKRAFRCNYVFIDPCTKKAENSSV